jgi:hypothetical protein
MKRPHDQAEPWLIMRKFLPRLSAKEMRKFRRRAIRRLWF